MPTPVSAARQCLTEEAARALDDAVAVARRRSHAQTTSLHAISSLLSLPSSTLREACVRARSSAYSPRLQFRALELSVSVSLDRLPSSKTLDEPPVSNSLMAAIKRSQANQRRNPENFHLHQIHQIHQQQQQQTTSLLKVELKHFILSILDDPIVSRVFGEAGFRSCDIKFAIVHPPVAPSSRFSSRARCPPIFLCNLTDSNPDPGYKGFRFPFMGVSDGEGRRIGEVLIRKNGKNPLLVGVCAKEALNSFSECLERERSGGILPAEIIGLKMVSIEKEISEFMGSNKDERGEEKIGLKFKELSDLLKNCSGPGIILNFGELNGFLISDNGDSNDPASFLVSKLTGLLEVYNGKLWLIGAAGTYETYSKFLGRYPAIENWDMHVLPITSSKASTEGFCSRPSLMGSFVPFGGFFSTPSDFKIPLSSTNQFVTRCHLCNEKYEQEVSAILKGGPTISVADQYSASLPSWLQMAELDPSKREDAAKAKDDRTAVNAKIMGLQKKWNDICQRLHHIPQFPKSDISLARTQVPGTEGFQFVADRMESSSKDSSLSESGGANLSPCKPTDLQQISPPKPNERVPVASEAEYANFQSKLPIKSSSSQLLETERPWLPPYPLPNLSLPPDRISSSSVVSVTTDLGLGTLYTCPSQEPKKPKFQDHKERLQHFSGPTSVDFDVVSKCTSNQIGKSSSHSGPDFGGQLDPRDFKSLWRDLIEKVGRQEEAIYTISQTLSCWRTGTGKLRDSNLKGDIWLSFLGPDKVGMKKVAAALAEIMFGSRDRLISLDLSGHDGINQSNSIFDCQELNGYDVKFRGKTVVDYIAEELGRRPHSVVFLENVDKADMMAQISLSQAVRTGKFQDSHGREIGINDMIFVTTSTITNGDKNIISGKGNIEFSEERILGAKSWQMQILIESVAGNASRSSGTNLLVTPRKGTSNPVSVNKRKLIDTSDSTEPNETLDIIPKWRQKASKSFLDLNLPVEEMEDSEHGYYGSDSLSENSETWLEEFFDQVDEKVIFKPFDFDALADKVLKEINLNFQKTVGLEASLEIDCEVMLQILAAAWLTDRKGGVEDWVERVLSRSFAEARQRHRLTAHSVLKLVACEGHFVKERAPGVCLPARIILD